MSKPVLKLSGLSGNAFAILAEAQKVAKENGLDWDKINAEATRGSYDNLLHTICDYFEVC